MKKRLWTPATLGLALLIASSAWANVPKETSPEEQALQKRAEAFVAAFNKGDPTALAAFWTPNGDMVDQEGHLIKGRAAIEEAYQKFFAESKGAKLFIKITSLRVVRPDLAVEDGLTEVVFPDGPPAAARYTIVYVKEDEKWYLESVREATAVPPTNTEHLQDLAFLIGNWVEDVEGGGSAKAAYSWDENRNFIVNTFDVTIKDVAVASGTQWIGWDAVDKKPRAWSFLFNGGFAEGVWTKDGNTWKIAIQAKTRDGKKLNATNVFTKIDPDHLSFQFIDRTLDGQPLPDDKVVKMKRAN